MTRGALLGLLAAVLPGGTTAAATRLTIEHDGLRCVVAGRNPVLGARVAPSEAVARARAYFRAEGRPHWYYVDMHPEAGLFRALLPRPLPTTPRIEYYLEALDRSFSAARTGDFRPVVGSGLAPCREKLAAAPLTAAHLVVGAAEGAPPLPEGFSSEGLTPAASLPGAASAPAPKGGGGHAALLIGGLAAAGAAGVALAASGSKDAGPAAPAGPGALARDDDGDGLSENEGDCNDSDPTVRPGGDFEFTVAFPFTGNVNCLTSPPWTYAVRIANKGCNALPYTLIYQQQILGLPPEAEGRTPGTVAPGATEMRTLFGDPATSLLCCRSTCPSGFINQGQETWTIETPLGTRSLSNSFSFDDGTCPVCGT
jgi:hypothetical protein